MAAAARRAWRRASRAPSRPTGARSSPGPAWELDEPTGEYYLHLFSPQAAGPELGEPARSATAVYAMMRWWLDRGVDGFRMDVINMISKDPALPDGVVTRGGCSATASASYVCGPRIHEFLHEMHREVFAGRAGRLLTVGEMPGVDGRAGARLFTDPARAEIDMVFQFEHVGLDHGAAASGTSARCDLPRPQGVARPLAGRRWPTSAGTASTGTTTTSRGSCPGSATTASTGSQSATTAGHRAAPAPRHAVRLPGRGARA